MPNRARFACRRLDVTLPSALLMALGVVLGLSIVEALSTRSEAQAMGKWGRAATVEPVSLSHPGR